MDKKVTPEFASAEERQAWDRYVTAAAVPHASSYEKAAEIADMLLLERRKRFGVK